MIMSRFSPVSVCLVLLVLAACGGGAGGNAGPVAASASSGSSYQIAVSVPQGPIASARGRKYVSPNTQSVEIATVYPSGSGPNTIANISAANPNCAPSVPAGSLVCQVTLLVQTGAQSFIVAAYDQPNAMGNVLSTGTIAVPPPAGALTVVRLVLNGVPAALNLAFIGAVPVPGRPGTFALAVNALDAAGATIVGPGNFSSPITLQTDTPSHVSINPTTVTAPEHR